MCTVLSVSRPSVAVLYLVAAGVFFLVGALQLVDGSSRGWLSLLATVLLANAARTSRTKPETQR